MKRLIFFSLALFIGVMSAQAQSGFGLRAGLMFADQKVDVADGFNINPKSKTGFDVNLFYDKDLGNGMRIQPELHYTQMGFKIGGIPIITPKAELNYLRIPLLLKYDVLSNNDNMVLSPIFGPYFSFLLSDDIDLVSLFTNNLPFNDTDFGFDFGLMFNMSSGLYVDARYTLGLQNVADIPVGELKNRGFSAGIGYRFTSSGS